MATRTIDHITPDMACRNVERWARERKWSLARAAEEMDLNLSTLKAWLREEGWTCNTHRVWVRRKAGEEAGR